MSIENRLKKLEEALNPATAPVLVLMFLTLHKGNKEAFKRMNQTELWERYNLHPERDTKNIMLIEQLYTKEEQQQIMRVFESKNKTTKGGVTL